MKNQIIVAMDMDIPEGIKLISKLRTSEKIYGYKIGSLWILDRGVEVLKSVRDMLNEVKSEQKIILDMQKWGTDIPDIIKKQVEKVAPYVDELICCPMGAGSESLKMFADTCIFNKIEPICVFEMTHPGSDSYLNITATINILNDAIESSVYRYVIPATKEPNEDIKSILERNHISNPKLYATGFKVQGGQTKPMIDFGVTKFIVGRAIYESGIPLLTVDDIYKEINEV